MKKLQKSYKRRLKARGVVEWEEEVGGKKKTEKKEKKEKKEKGAKSKSKKADPS